MRSPIWGHIVYPSTGSWMGLQFWAHSGGWWMVCSHWAQLLLSFPLHEAMQVYGITPSLAYVWLRQKSRLTCLLYLVLSHRLEKRLFSCAVSLWESRAVQCKRLRNLRFCVWHYMWQVCLHSSMTMAVVVWSVANNAHTWKTALISTGFTMDAQVSLLLNFLSGGWSFWGI